MATIIRPHTCQSPYQDRVYGKGMRVFNEPKAANAEPHCTVCCATAHSSRTFRMNRSK